MANDDTATPQAVIAASLRRERTRAGLSLSEVAARAGIAKSTLSQLESGSGNPSLETLWALCVALDMPFSRLLDPPRPVVHVIRAGEGPAVAAERSDYHCQWPVGSPRGRPVIVPAGGQLVFPNGGQLFPHQGQRSGFTPS
ncbi:helix-turn-helix domain-containing protein, partial [Nocardia farcinica]|uniref:helix-turn-helix domain-containing protein n=1 Tax=Nocardia farcinica TaxID=37329 RepID=UPI001E390E50